MFDWNDQEVCRIVFFSFSFFLVKLIQYVYWDLLVGLNVKIMKIRKLGAQVMKILAGIYFNYRIYYIIFFFVFFFFFECVFGESS